MIRLALVVTLLAVGCGPATPKSETPEGPTLPPDPPAEPAPKADLVKLYRDWVALGNAGDWDALARRYTEDATITPASSGMTLRGPANIVEFFKSFNLGFPDLTTYPLLLIETDDTLFAVSMARGTNSEPMGPSPATGKTTSFVGLSKVTFEGDDIARTVVYADNLNFLGHLGQWQGDSRPVDETVPDEPIVVRARGTEPDLARVAVVRRWAELLSAHDAPGLLALYTPDAILDDSHLAAPIITASAIANHYSDFIPAFPDLAISELETWSAGPYVVATFRLTGTNGGIYERLDARKTMRQIDLEAAAIFELRGDPPRIAQQWVFVDGMAMAMQLGALKITPPPDAEPIPAPLN